jgi:N-acetylglucosamine-6-phosphate deacetylase
MVRAFTADRIFTGTEWLHGYAVVCDQQKIIDLIPSSSLPPDIQKKNFDGKWISPAFIDIQIYGASGKLFAAYPEPDSLKKLADYCYKGGAAYCLPTVATNTKKVFFDCIDAIKKYWKEGGKGILGLHLEGPWINPTKKGAHTESLIHPPKEEEVDELLEYGRGVIRMITLAPEVCDPALIDKIREEGIVISAGHSNAKYKEAIEAFDRYKIPTVTHLYNGMSGLQHREPGLVSASFDHEKVMASIIADGHHVDFAAIRIAKKIMGDRLFAITDAVTETTIGNHRHQLVGDKYEVDGILSGSALTMFKAMKNLVNHVGIELGEAIRMCSLYPARVLQMGNAIGKIEKGMEAKFVVVDNEMENAQIVDSG